jgi:phage-related protein
MAKLACPRMAFAKETAIAFTKCCSKREELIAKIEAFLDKVNCIRVPHHLEYVRLYYVRKLELISEMAHSMDEYTQDTGNRLVRYKNMLKTKQEVSTHILDRNEDMFNEDMNIIHSSLNDVEELLNKVDKDGTQALKVMHRVDKPCGFKLT